VKTFWLDTVNILRNLDPNITYKVVYQAPEAQNLKIQDYKTFDSHPTHPASFSNSVLDLSFGKMLYYYCTVKNFVSFSAKNVNYGIILHADYRISEGRWKLPKNTNISCS
jgi:hypothetical protein